MNTKKEKISIAQQIEHMKSKGITFNYTDEKDAISFLSERTYYFKLKAYRENYNKNNDGKYVNLDFEYLKELSILDMHIRRMVLTMAINIEHAIKTDLNASLCHNDKEDGYAIVNSFLSVLNKKGEIKYKYIIDGIEKKFFSLYSAIKRKIYGTFCILELH